jgi:lipopolysaccharide export system protein LptC
MIYRLLAVLAALALIVGVVLLSSGPPRENATPAHAGGVLPQEPGYSALNTRLVQTGADGHPLYTLDAARILQQPDQERVQLEQVQLGFRDASGDLWSAHAERGELGQDSGIVQLEGSVHVEGTLPGTEEQAQIVTERLGVDTHAQVLATRDPVELTMSGRTLDAQGLVASLKERRVQLESAVHGSFRP